MTSSASYSTATRDDDRDLELLDQLASACVALNAQIARRIIGQRDTVDNLVAAILAGGHALLVGVPGLAKTLLVHTVAEALDLKFSRVQFTPDLMPSDITGTELLEEDHSTGRRFFKFVHGPIFANIVLADEINRAPPKTQAALLQAMQEHAVTAASKTHVLAEPFFVLATQNPIEQEGTYPLPAGAARRVHGAAHHGLSEPRGRGAHRGRNDDGCHAWQLCRSGNAAQQQLPGAGARALPAAVARRLRCDSAPRAGVRQGRIRRRPSVRAAFVSLRLTRE